jgi:hypothetical protein
MYFSQLLGAQKADIAGQRFGASARRTRSQVRYFADTQKDEVEAYYFKEIVFI